MFKNMKIPVENNLDEVVAELQKRSYILDSTYGKNFVYTNKDGTIDCFNTDTKQDWFQLTTLAELRSMDIETLNGGVDMSENMISVYQKINKRRQKDKMDVNALTMFAEAWDYQQAKIDELQKRIDNITSIVHDAYMSDGNSSVEIVYDKIKELLK